MIHTQMTEQEVHEWLYRARRLQKRIEAKKTEKKQIWAMATDISPNTDGTPHAPGVSDKVGNAAVKLVMIADEIERLINQYVNDRCQIIRTIEKLPEPEQGALHGYYILGMTWEKVAESMGYSSSQIYRHRENGLKIVRMILNESI